MFRRVFDNIDADKDGYITSRDLKTTFSKMMVDSSESKIQKWISMRDVDQDGKVAFEEFIMSFDKLLLPDLPEMKEYP